MSPRESSRTIGQGVEMGLLRERPYVDAVKTREKKLREAIWLQLGEKDVLSGREFLDRCLVGRWG